MRFLAVCIILAVCASAYAAKDPKECEVCIKVVNDIKEATKGMKDLEKIESTLQKVCSKAGSTQEKKLCYYIEPIQREVSRPIANGLPADRICQKLKKNSDKGEKIPEEPNQDYNKMTLKQLRNLLAQRGVTCEGCIEKSDFVKKAEATRGAKAQSDL